MSSSGEIKQCLRRTNAKDTPNKFNSPCFVQYLQVLFPTRGAPIPIFLFVREVFETMPLKIWQIQRECDNTKHDMTNDVE